MIKIIPNSKDSILHSQGIRWTNEETNRTLLNVNIEEPISLNTYYTR